MELNITHWIEADGRYVGFLNNYPDYQRQGKDLEELKTRLTELQSTMRAHRNWESEGGRVRKRA